MDFTLKKIQGYTPPGGPLLLIIADGVGVYRGEADGYPGNAFELAKPENMQRLIASEPLSMSIKAHGTAVGMPSDEDQGNSEVGHNAIGAGRVFAQGLTRTHHAVAAVDMETEAACRCTCRQHGTGPLAHLLQKLHGLQPELRQPHLTTRGGARRDPQHRSTAWRRRDE